jgi:hypothetical protein
MADLLEKQIDAALEKGRAVRETEPRADSAYFDKKSGRIVIRMGRSLAFLLALLRVLQMRLRISSATLRFSGEVTHSIGNRSTSISRFRIS